MSDTRMKENKGESEKKEVRNGGVMAMKNKTGVFFFLALVGE